MRPPENTFESAKAMAQELADRHGDSYTVYSVGSIVKVWHVSDTVFVNPSSIYVVHPRDGEDEHGEVGGPVLESE